MKKRPRLATLKKLNNSSSADPHDYELVHKLIRAEIWTLDGCVGSVKATSVLHLFTQMSSKLNEPKIKHSSCADSHGNYLVGSGTQWFKAN